MSWKYEHRISPRIRSYTSQHNQLMSNSTETALKPGSLNCRPRGGWEILNGFINVYCIFWCRTEQALNVCQRMFTITGSWRSRRVISLTSTRALCFTRSAEPEKVCTSLCSYLSQYLCIIRNEIQVDIFFRNIIYQSLSWGYAIRCIAGRCSLRFEMCGRTAV